MSIKFRFSRDESGKVDFSERACASAIAAMSAEPILPKSTKDAIDRELIRLIRELALRHKISFDTALDHVKRDHAGLLQLSVKSQPVSDDHYYAEVGPLADDDESSRTSRPVLRRAI